MKAQGVLVPRTPEGLAALEQWRTTGELPPPPSPEAGIQTQHHAGSMRRRTAVDPADKRMSKLPALPADREVATSGELTLFDGTDVDQALKVYQQACLTGTPRTAIREVMMFALAIAAVNLDVKPDPGLQVL